MNKAFNRRGLKLTNISFNLNNILNSLRDVECHTKHLNGKEMYFATCKPVICNDGYLVSIQCGKHNYCKPRITFNLVDKYTFFELGFPSSYDSLLDTYCEDSTQPTNTVYGYVPREVVNQLIRKHGGVNIAQQEMLSALIS